MVCTWDIDKPCVIYEKTWKRQQIDKYMDLNFNDRPLDLLNWIQSQSPNPWPSWDTNRIGNIMRRIRNSRRTVSISVRVYSMRN